MRIGQRHYGGPCAESLGDACRSPQARRIVWVLAFLLVLCLTPAAFPMRAHAAERPQVDNGETWQDWPGTDWTWRDIAWRLWGYRDPYGPVPAVMEAAIDGEVRQFYEASTRAYHQVLRVYAESRIVNLTYQLLEPAHYGPWTAHKDYYATDADSDGALTEWEDSYYVTHDWSYYGIRILSIIPGDTVEINGRTMEVTDIFDYPKAAYSDEIWELVGKDAVILQTCEPDSNLNRIAYGKWVTS